MLLEFFSVCKLKAGSLLKCTLSQNKNISIITLLAEHVKIKIFYCTRIDWTMFRLFNSSLSGLKPHFKYKIVRVGFLFCFNSVMFENLQASNYYFILCLLVFIPS